MTEPQLRDLLTDMFTADQQILPDGTNEAQITTAAAILSKEPKWMTMPWLSHGCVMLFFPNPDGPDYSYRSSIIRPDGSVGNIADLLGEQKSVTKIK